jgi:hypothetical protein
MYVLLAITTNSRQKLLTLFTAATSFCKCTCFGNSTIIALSGSTSASKDPTKKDSSVHHGTCNDCNRKFCMDYNLPICKSAKEEDILTTCFQRDSAKDEAVVFIFITATVGLLVYAAVRPWAEKWAEVGCSSNRTYWGRYVLTSKAEYARKTELYARLKPGWCGRIMRPIAQTCG